MAGPTPATVIIVTYNSQGTIGDVLDALRADPDGPAQIVVVDNASNDGTCDVVAGFPEVELIVRPTNEGFGAGCHTGAAAAASDALVFLNPDALPRPGWLPPLVVALGQPAVGAAMATLELADRPGHFNTSGGELTYFGLAWATDVGMPIEDESAEPVDAAFPSGAAMAITRSAWDRAGGFRPELFLYHEDSDLGWRLRTMGLRSVRVPDSRVAHHYEFARNPDKLFYVERNRLLLLGANYRRSTLALLAPALVAVELGIVLTAWRDGWLGAKLRTWPAAWRLRRINRNARRAVEAGRRVGDAALLETMGTSPAGITQVTAPPGSRWAGRLLGGYLRLVLPIVRAADRRLGPG